MARDLDTLFPPACRGVQDIVLKTQLSLVRNHPEHPFPQHMTRREGLAFAEELCERVKSLFGAEDVTDDPLTSDIAETYFGLSPLSRRGPFYRLLRKALGRGSYFWIEVGAMNHLTFSVLCEHDAMPQQAEALWGLVSLYERRYPFAYAQPWGYLSAQLSFAGTGFRIRTWVHVPGLSHFDQLTQLCNAAERYGCLVEIDGPEDEAPPGNLAILFNRSTMDAPVAEIARRHRRFLGMLCDAEDQARRRLRLDFPFVLYDRVKRMRGLLRDAEMLEPDEALDVLSAYRLGIATGALKGREAKAGFPHFWFESVWDGPMIREMECRMTPEEQTMLVQAMPPGVERHGYQHSCCRVQWLRMLITVRLDPAFVREAKEWRG